MNVLRSFCVVLLAGMAAAASLENLPTDSWVYDDLDLLKTSGLIHAMPSTSRPWTRAEAVVLVAEADSIARLRSPGPAQRAALGRLRSEFGGELPELVEDVGARRPVVNLAVPGVENGFMRADFFTRAGLTRKQQSASIGAVLSNRPGDVFAFYERGEFTMFRPDTVDITDSAGTHVPGSRTHSWMELATLEVEHAYLAFKIPWLRLEVGRDAFFWGPGHVSSCMLSDNAPALDHIQLSASYRNFKFLGLTSYLSRWGLKHRFLSAQRLEVSLWHRVTLGGALMSVYSWDSLQTRSFFGMMNPLIPVYLEVAGSGHDDNLLVGWDAAVYLPQTRVYGQLFVDNFEFLERESKPCNALAWQAGFHWAPMLPVQVRAEYVRITAFTYYHRIYHIMYENYGVPLGHELGPDADQFFVSTTATLGPGLELQLRADHTRRGYYNRGDFEQKTWHAGQNLPGRFPAEEHGEEVERTVRGELGVGAWVGRDLHLVGTVGYWMSSNYEGVPDAEANGWDFSLGLEYRY